MKVFGIYILTDRTLRILLEFARNTELNEITYRKLLDEGTNIEQSISSSSEPVYLLPSSYPFGTSLSHRWCQLPGLAFSIFEIPGICLIKRLWDDLIKSSMAIPEICSLPKREKPQETAIISAGRWRCITFYPLPYTKPVVERDILWGCVV